MITAAIEQAPGGLLGQFAGDARTTGRGRLTDQLADALAARGFSPPRSEPTADDDTALGEVRARLRDAEARQDLDVIVTCLHELAMDAYGRQVTHRLSDLAGAMRLACKRAGDQPSLATALGLDGIAHDLAGDAQTAADCWTQALARRPDACHIEGNLGWAHVRLGNAEPASKHLRSALRRSVETGAVPIEIRVRWYQAEHERRFGDQRRSETMLQSAIDRAREAGDGRGETTLSALLNHWRGGDDVDADDALSAVEMPLSRPVPKSEGPALAREAAQLRADGDLEAAKTKIADAYGSYEQAGDLRGMSACLNDQAGWASLAGDVEEAIRLATEALDLRRRVPDLNGEVLGLANIAFWRLHRAANREEVDRVERLARQATTIARSTGPTRPALQAWTVLLLAQASRQASRAELEDTIRRGQEVSDALGSRHTSMRRFFADTVGHVQQGLASPDAA
jgi:tetratricopeptide (TPR) repeat protein